MAKLCRIEVKSPGLFQRGAFYNGTLKNEKGEFAFCRMTLHKESGLTVEVDAGPISARQRLAGQILYLYLQMLLELDG